MGLKDDLIAKANSGGKKEEETPVNDDFYIDDSSLDFSSIESEIGVSDPPAFVADPEPIQDPEPELYIDPIPEPEPFVQEIPQPQQYQQPPQQQYYQPQLQVQPQSQPQQYQPNVSSHTSFQDILDNKEEYRRDSYQESYVVNEPVRNDLPQMDYYNTPEVVEDESYSSGSYDNSGIKNDLLKLAKNTILSDISENFDSAIFTKESMQNLINSYLNKKNGDEYSNMNALFVSLLDEVNNNKYEHDYYKDLSAEVINSIKGDIPVS